MDCYTGYQLKVCARSLSLFFLSNNHFEMVILCNQLIYNCDKTIDWRTLQLIIDCHITIHWSKKKAFPEP